MPSIESVRTNGKEDEKNTVVRSKVLGLGIRPRRTDETMRRTNTTNDYDERHEPGRANEGKPVQKRMALVEWL